MRTIWVIADTHFDHKKMMEYCGRPENFNDLIIERWNKVVKPEDLVIHLGDFAFANKERVTQLASMLNGHKIITMGNHDERRFAWYLDCGFDFACYQFSFKYLGKKLLFSHTPMTTPAIEEYAYNIHGHLHNGEHRDEYLKNPIYNTHKDKFILVSIEGSLCPVTLSSLISVDNFDIIST